MVGPVLDPLLEVVLGDVRGGLPRLRDDDLRGGVGVDRLAVELLLGPEPLGLLALPALPVGPLVTSGVEGREDALVLGGPVVPVVVPVVLGGLPGVGGVRGLLGAKMCV